ncbi:MAG: prolipoprotein diacylglyceryl transferase [Gammaproteobacteria bacterium]|nr:prolipoprotein diacylglyceryl transferase [Gammaproteobacteria bacterium]
MLPYPDIDKVALELGPIKVHWYGLMYLVGFLAGWWLGRRRAERFGWTKSQVDDLVFYVVIGVLLGGRLGHALFYEPMLYLQDPTAILRVWTGGMSFHGGLIGVLIAVCLFARRYKKTFFATTDFLAPLCPLGLGAGRIGNFINGELWGKPTDAPWGMVFPSELAGGLARHPSQLYQAALEGIVLFAILWFFTKRPRPTMSVSGLFLIGYGVFRFLIEFVREPDWDIGYVAFDWLTMGQVLSIPMIVIGLVLIWLAYRHDGSGASTPRAAGS